MRHEMENPVSATRPLAVHATMRAAILLAVLLAPPALADARSDAKRHFREGMSLIGAGQIERGIGELKQAVAIKREDGMFEGETIPAKTRATAREIAAELSGTHEAGGEDIFEEQVVTASVRSSSETKTPASLTVITGDEIRMIGAATIPEILRRVPGIDVAEMNPSDTNISVRGFNRRLANKVLVLVDGRSVYQDFLGGTFWPVLDVAIQDIDRIEVIRGPGSALYGANAFAGVVNIITRTGEDVSGARVFGQAGDHGTYQGVVTTGGKTGKLTYRTTFAYDRADKWTRDFAAGRVDLSSQFPQPDRSREIQRADLLATYDFGTTQVTAGAGFDNVAMQVVPIRSEEHTSELQSLRHLVCRLLLE